MLVQHGQAQGSLTAEDSTSIASWMIVDPDTLLHLSEFPIGGVRHKIIAIGPHVCIRLENYISLVCASDVYNLRRSACQRAYASISVGLFFLVDAPAPR